MPFEASGQGTQLAGAGTHFGAQALDFHRHEMYRLAQVTAGDRPAPFQRPSQTGDYGGRPPLR